MITLSINVDEIDKSRFYTLKNGKRMLDLILIETPTSKYGTDYLVKQGRTKEERDKGLKPQLPILGNAKIYENKSGGKPVPQSTGGGEDW